MMSSWVPPSREHEILSWENEHTQHQNHASDSSGPVEQLNAVTSHDPSRVRWESPLKDSTGHDYSDGSEVPSKVRRRQVATEEGYVCDFPSCIHEAKVFKTASELRKHQQAHKPYNERRHACSICGRRFHYPKDVKRHMRSHLHETNKSPRQPRSPQNKDTSQTTTVSELQIPSPAVFLNPGSSHISKIEASPQRSVSFGHLPFPQAQKRVDESPEIPEDVDRHGRIATHGWPSAGLRRPRLYAAVHKVMRRRNMFRAISLVLSRGTDDSSVSLCTTCEGLGLSYGSFVIGSQISDHDFPSGKSTLPLRAQIQGKRSLGDLRDILKKSVLCPLCRLIVRSLAEQDHTNLSSLLADLDSGVFTAALKSTFPNLNATCEATWQIDGREKTTDDDGNEVEVPCTRRLCIQWPKSGYSEAHIVLVYPNVEFGPRSLFLGRLLTSLDGPKVEQIRRWYQLCLEGHGEKCASDPADEELEDLRKESYFGVLDVRDMCLTALPPKSSYAALSYTWGRQQGDSKPFKATLKNVSDLKKLGGVRKIQEHLPRTIQDSIDLVRKLGIQYIWIDKLCILQPEDGEDEDENEMWTLNAKKMDVVYGHATLTICAADGEDASCGLKALHPIPQSRYAHHGRQSIERIKPDMQLMVSYPSETYVSRSIWNTRAWTFQERVLSKRCLIFVEGRVYLQCRSSTMSEDIHAEEVTAGWSMQLLHGPLQRYRILDQLPIDVYKYSVSLYTKRDLTHEEDILAAFGGIGKEICSRLGGEPIYALPNTHFDLALLWKPENAPERRRKKGKLKFPSWSWCGWKSTGIEYSPSFVEGCEINLHEWLMNHTWITWYIRDGHGNLRLVWDPLVECKDAAPIESRWRGYCGNVTGHPHNSDGLDSVKDRYQRQIPKPLQKYPRDTFDKTMPKYPYQVRMVEPGKRHRRQDAPLEDQRFLQFWTWSANFYLIPEDLQQPFSRRKKSVSSNLIRFGIEDGDHNIVGTITLGASWTAWEDVETRQYEFIAISDAKGFAEEEMREWNYIEPALPARTEWYAYNVLLLLYDDEIQGVARRAGLGKIYKRAFDTACVGADQKKKRWKEIILG